MRNDNQKGLILTYLDLYLLWLITLDENIIAHDANDILHHREHEISGILQKDHERDVKANEQEADRKKQIDLDRPRLIWLGSAQ